MKTNYENEAKLVKKLIKHLESNKGFVKEACYPIMFDCANCRGQMLIGLLDWYLELLKD